MNSDASQSGLPLGTQDGVASLLVTAALQGRIKTVRGLVLLGADVNEPNKKKA